LLAGIRKKKPFDVEGDAMTRKLEGKVCIITGGTAGIGKATVERFLGEGAKVLFCGKNSGVGKSVEKGLDNKDAVFIRCDVAVESDVNALIAEALSRFDRLDILINNAAKGAVGLITEISTEAWQRSNAVNVDSIFYTCRAAIPQMKKQGGGVIINVASISGIAGDGAYPSYSTQKAAVVNLTRAMAVYHARENIRISALCPGLIETPATEAFGAVPGLLQQWHKLIPAQRPGQAHEMANVLAFLASDDASYMHGAVIVADGGITAATGQPTQVPLS